MPFHAEIWTKTDNPRKSRKIGPNMPLKPGTRLFWAKDGIDGKGNWLETESYTIEHDYIKYIATRSSDGNPPIVTTDKIPDGPQFDCWGDSLSVDGPAKGFFGRTKTKLVIKRSTS